LHLFKKRNTVKVTACASDWLRPLRGRMQNISFPSRNAHPVVIGFARLTEVIAVKREVGDVWKELEGPFR
jgi:hypothetical protein